MEIAWLKERGLVSSYEDYLRLPIAVLDDVRMLAEGEAQEAQRRRSNEGGKRRGNRR